MGKVLHMLNWPVYEQWGFDYEDERLELAYHYYDVIHRATTPYFGDDIDELHQLREFVRNLNPALFDDVRRYFRLQQLCLGGVPLRAAKKIVADEAAVNSVTA